MNKAFPVFYSHAAIGGCPKGGVCKDLGTELFSDEKISFLSDDGVNVKVFFVGCHWIEDCLREIVDYYEM